MPVRLNGIAFSWQPDCGSVCNIIGRHHLKEYEERTKNKAILKPVTKCIKAANDSLMTFDGYFIAQLSSASTSIQAKIYVMPMDKDERPILGEKALLSLGLICYDPKGGFVKQITTKISQPALKINISDPVFAEKFRLLHKQYSKVFQGLGRLKNFEAELTLNADAPPTLLQRSRPPPLHLKAAADARIDDFVKQGILSPVPSDYPVRYCSPIIIVPKPNKPGEVRLCGNFIKINKFLYRNSYLPAPRIEDFAAKMTGATVFARLDLNHCYFQIPISDKSKDLCILSTWRGMYFLNSLGMGLSPAQDISDSRIQLALSHCEHTIVSRDDILIGHQNISGLYEEYRKVLAALLSNNLTCDPSKTAVGLDSIAFHGYILDKDGLRPCPSKIKALRLTRRPQTQKGITSFICTVGYNSRFINNFSSVCKPLRELAQTQGKLEWNTSHQEAFEYLKNALCENTLNHYFIRHRTTAVFADAGVKQFTTEVQSGGLGAILAQKCNDTGDWLPIHFASRALTDCETRMPQIHLESIAIRFACDRFRFYLEGAPKFIIFSDCRPVVQLFNKCPGNCPPRIMRMIIAIQDLDWEVVYKDGQSQPADWLSRSPPPPQEEDKKDMELSDQLEILNVKQVKSMGNYTCMSKIRHEVASDPDMQFLIERLRRGDFDHHKKDARIKPFLGLQHELSEIDGIVFRGDHIIVLPEKLRHIITELHHAIGHQGETNLMALLKESFWFPSMYYHVQAVTSTCHICQLTKVGKRKEPYGIPLIPNRPFQHISLDYKSLSNGTYVLVFMCILTRYPDVAFTTSTSYEAARLPIMRYFARYGTCIELKSDSGPPFQSDEFAKFALEQGFKHTRVIVRHPQSNSEVERLMATIDIAYQRAKLLKTSYKEEIILAIKAKRCTPHPELGLSPYEIVFGTKMPLGQISIPEAVLPSSQDRTRAVKRFDTVAQKLFQSKWNRKLAHDLKRNVLPHDFRKNDLVLVIWELDSKQKKRYEQDIYRVTLVEGPKITAINTKNGKIISRHANHFKRYYDPVFVGGSTVNVGSPIANINDQENQRATTETNQVDHRPHTRSMGRPVEHPNVMRANLYRSPTEQRNAMERIAAADESDEQTQQTQQTFQDEMPFFEQDVDLHEAMNPEVDNALGEPQGEPYVVQNPRVDENLRGSPDVENIIPGVDNIVPRIESEDITPNPYVDAVGNPESVDPEAVASSSASPIPPSVAAHSEIAAPPNPPPYDTQPPPPDSYPTQETVAPSTPSLQDTQPAPPDPSPSPRQVRFSTPSLQDTQPAPPDPSPSPRQVRFNTRVARRNFNTTDPPNTIPRTGLRSQQQQP